MYIKEYLFEQYSYSHMFLCFKCPHYVSFKFIYVQEFYVKNYILFRIMILNLNIIIKHDINHVLVTGLNYFIMISGFIDQCKHELLLIFNLKMNDNPYI